MAVVSRLSGWLIRGYQLSFSVVFGRYCRFYPTCSDYAMQAIEKHGAVRGMLLAGRRICRCGPQPRWLGGGHGFDPVPEVWHDVWKCSDFYRCRPRKRVRADEAPDVPMTPKQDA